MSRRRLGIAEELKMAMAGKVIVKLPSIIDAAKFKRQDWVLFAVVAHKGETKKTKTDKLYSTWKLTDMKGVTVIMNVFDEAFSTLWKIEPGTVIALLNPTLAYLGVSTPSDFFPLSVFKKVEGLIGFDRISNCPHYRFRSPGQ